MAGTAVIGALRVTLGLDSAEFMKAGKTIDRQINHMERKFREMGRTLQRTGTQLSAGITAPLAALGVAVARTAQQMAQNARDMQTSAQVAGEGFEEFQRQAHAARQVGIEFEKLGDIFKDVRDRVGDFVSTGGGPMADFFENIAPKVGITAEAFRGLSGRDALQLYYDSLRRANVSQEEMVFYLEAMASDATALIPVLAQGEEGWRRYGESAAVISEDQLASFEEIRLAQERFEQAWQKLAITVVSSGLLDAIVGVAEGFSALFEAIARTNPAILQGAAAVGVVAAALGPVIYTVGSLTVALAPLSAAFTVATRAMRTATGAAGVATLTLTGLRAGIVAMMATLGPWVIGIAAVSAALYLLTRRTNAGLEQANAFREGLQSLANVQERNRDITERLSTATGQLREELLASARAAREDAKAQLEDAQARLRNARIAARQRIEEARAEQRLTAATTPTGGNLLSGRPALRETARRNLMAAENEIARINGEATGLMQEIARLTRTISAPAPNYGSNSGGAAGAISAAASEAAQEAEELQALLDRLFPEIARLRQFREEVVKLADLPADIRREAESALRYELAGVERNGDRPEIDVGAPEMDEILQGMNRLPQQLRRVADETEQQNERIVDSFRDMVYDVRYSLDSFARGIKSGNVLDIFFGLMDSLDSIGRALTGGKGFSIGGLTFGGARAMGGPVQAGSAYLVGENGPEIFAPHASGQIVPNHAMAKDSASLRVTVSMDPSTGQLGAFVRDETGRMIAEAAGPLAKSASDLTLSRISRARDRSLRQ